jgi:hypothetical protein
MIDDSIPYSVIEVVDNRQLYYNIFRQKYAYKLTQETANKF